MPVIKLEDKRVEILQRFFDETLELHRQGKVVDLVLVYSIRSEESGENNKYTHHWTGESCLGCLGLTQRMAHIIQCYMNEED
jgi:hypothetical protein